MKIVWSRRASKDAENIIDYISRDNQSEAFELIDEIEEKILKLKEFPELGRMVPEFGSKYIRELIIRNFYRVIYEIETDEFVIVTLRQTRMDTL